MNNSWICLNHAAAAAAMTYMASAQFVNTPITDGVDQCIVHQYAVPDSCFMLQYLAQLWLGSVLRPSNLHAQLVSLPREAVVAHDVDGGKA